MVDLDLYDLYPYITFDVLVVCNSFFFFFFFFTIVSWRIGSLIESRDRTCKTRTAPP